MGTLVGKSANCAGPVLTEGLVEYATVERKIEKHDMVVIVHFLKQKEANASSEFPESSSRACSAVLEKKIAYNRSAAR